MSQEKTDTSFDVVAIGEPLVEFNERSDGLYLKGFGGDTSNCLISAARMGASTAYVTQVGDDPFGNDLIALWTEEGIFTGGVRIVPAGVTGIYFVSHDASGHHFHYRRAHSAASQMDRASLPRKIIANAKWLHFSGISQAISESSCDAVFEAVQCAKRVGVQISYDLNFRPNLWSAKRALDMAKATLQHCDLFFPSVDEVAAVSGLTQPADIIQWSHALGAKMVALKLGKEGSLVSTAEGIQKIAPYPVQALDATGAGDCYAGALLARLAQGSTLADAARAANIAAALCTQGYGAVTPIPRWSDVRRRM